MKSKIEQAQDIARTYDVSTDPDGAVFYSISFMPHERNKTEAMNFIAMHPNAKMLDDTPCGKAITALGLTGKVNEISEEIAQIWHTASARYVKAASGNVNAFVEGADERSTFCTTELKGIIENPRITHINGVIKSKFIANFKPKHY